MKTELQNSRLQNIYEAHKYMYLNSNNKRLTLFLKTLRLTHLFNFPYFLVSLRTQIRTDRTHKLTLIYYSAFSAAKAM